MKCMCALLRVENTWSKDGAVVRVPASHQCGPGSIPAWGPFLEGPAKFSHPENHSKISNLMITELFYPHILNVNRGSLHTRSFKRIHFSVFWHRWTKNGFTGPKSFRGFRETGPWRHISVDWVCCWFSPCSEGFSPGSPVFLPPEKPTSPNSNLTSIDDPHEHQLRLMRLPPQIMSFILFFIWVKSVDPCSLHFWYLKFRQSFFSKI